MNKEINSLIEKIESLDWNVDEEGENIYRLSKYSPEGQDFSFTVEGNNKDELLSSMYEYYEDYDVSYETYLWLDNMGHGRNGAPYDMRDLYNDMEACREMVLELYNSLSG